VYVDSSGSKEQVQHAESRHCERQTNRDGGRERDRERERETEEKEKRERREKI